MRSRRRTAVGVVIAVALVSGCAVEPQVDVTSGTVESPEFNSHVKYYDLDLPADVNALEWVQLSDWDSNQLYLRFSTDRVGLAKLLQGYRLTMNALHPTSSSQALPRESGWDEKVPARFREWQPSLWSTARESDQVRDTNQDGLGLYVDLLIDRPTADRPAAFIHIVET